MINKLSCPKIKSDLRHCPIGQTIFYAESVPSTMQLAHDYASGSVSNEVATTALFLTEEQTAGRGRGNRTWQTPKGSALLMSILICPPLLPEDSSILPMAVGISVVDALTSILPSLQAHVALKWPNDVLLGRDIHPKTGQRSSKKSRCQDEPQKVAGLLIDTVLRGNRSYAVVGIGVNVHQRIEELPTAPPGAPKPTSLEAFTHITPDRTALAINLCKALSDSLMLTASEIFLHWRANLHTLGREVLVINREGVLNQQADRGDSSSVLRGKAVDVIPDGGLIIDLENGQQEIVYAGDVSIREDHSGR